MKCENDFFYVVCDNEQKRNLQFRMNVNDKTNLMSIHLIALRRLIVASHLKLLNISKMFDLICSAYRLSRAKEIIINLYILCNLDSNYFIFFIF